MVRSAVAFMPVWGGLLTISLRLLLPAKAVVGLCGLKNSF